MHMDLVPHRWYAILDPNEVPKDKPIGRRRLGQDLVFWRDTAGTIHAAPDRCPHRAAALSLGTVEEGCITCPFHGFRFGSDGACHHVPAHPGSQIAKKMSFTPLTLREAHGFLWAWSGPEGVPQGVEPSFFDDLDGFVWRGSQLLQPLDVHYTRAIENQLDWAHLAFVHRKSIGRGMAPKIEVESRMEGDRLYTKLAGDDNPIRLIGPNLWQLSITDKMRNVIAFAPIDDEHMIYYARTYQRVVHMPGLSHLFGWLNKTFNRRVLGEDGRVVVTQRPLKSSLDNGEVYVPSDRPILDYLRWRRAQTDKARALDEAA